MLAVAAHVVGAWFAGVFAFWKGHYFVWGEAFALGLGVVLLVPLVLIAMTKIEEIAAIAFGRKPRRLLAGDVAAAGAGSRRTTRRRSRSISRLTRKSRRC